MKLFERDIFDPYIMIGKSPKCGLRLTIDAIMGMAFECKSATIEPCIIIEDRINELHLYRHSGRAKREPESMQNAGFPPARE